MLLQSTGFFQRYEEYVIDVHASFSFKAFAYILIYLLPIFVNSNKLRKINDAWKVLIIGSMFIIPVELMVSFNKWLVRFLLIPETFLYSIYAGILSYKRAIHWYWRVYVLAFTITYYFYIVVLNGGNAVYPFKWMSS